MEKNKKLVECPYCRRTRFYKDWAEFKKHLKKIGGREFSHLLRLLQRSEPERQFAVAYLKNRDLTDLREKGLTEEQIKERSDYKELIEGEGRHTAMFWTFAPYLFKSLREKAIEDREAVNRILVWAKDGAESQRRQDDFRLSLRGLEDFVGINNTYVLSKDENHLSHKFTEQRAKKIIEEHFLTKEEKRMVHS